jgi:hypothetical protein
MEDYKNKSPSPLYGPATMTKKARKYRSYNPILHQSLDYSNSNIAWYEADNRGYIHPGLNPNSSLNPSPIARAARLSIGNTLKSSASASFFTKTRLRDEVRDPIMGTVKKVDVDRPPVKAFDKDLFEIHGAFRKSGICKGCSPFRSQTKLERKL